MDFDTKSSSKQDGAKERVDAEALLAGAVERVFRLRTALKETEAEAQRIRENLRAELMITKGDTADFEIDGEICYWFRQPNDADETCGSYLNRGNI